MAESMAAEQALLGSLMIDATAHARIAGRVDGSDFTSADHRAIFDVIERMQRQRLAVDTVTVMDKLRGRVDATYIGTLARDTPTAANVETYATVVRDRALKRDLRTFGEHVARSAGEAGSSAAVLIADFQQYLHRMQAASSAERGLVGPRELVAELVDDLQHRADGPRGLQLGLADLDEMTGGLGAGELMVFGGRPSTGKTAVMMNIACAVGARTGVAVFSAEMPRRQLMHRTTALQASIPQMKLRKPSLMNDRDWSTVNDALDVVAQLQVHIDDRAAPTVSLIRSQCIALKARHPLGLVMIDYIQLMGGAGRNRYEELRDISYALKALAKELQVPVIVLAQLNREVEKRGRRPMSADLRDSGAIEEAADQVVLLHAETSTNPKFAMPEVLELIVTKNRHGERGTCHVHYARDTGRIGDLDGDSKAQYKQLIERARRSSMDDGL